VAELTALRTAVVSQLATQHEEILQLRQQINGWGNVRVLHPNADNGQRK